jgi:hypothetical protein
MPNDESLHAPTPVMSEREPVHVTPETLEGDVPTVNAVLLFAIHRVVGHLRIEPDDYVTHRLEPIKMFINRHMLIGLLCLANFETPD